MGEPWARADTASFQQFSGPSARPSVARADSVYGGGAPASAGRAPTGGARPGSAKAGPAPRRPPSIMPVMRQQYRTGLDAVPAAGPPPTGAKVGSAGFRVEKKASYAGEAQVPEILLMGTAQRNRNATVSMQKRAELSKYKLRPGALEELGADLDDDEMDMDGDAGMASSMGGGSRAQTPMSLRGRAMMQGYDRQPYGGTRELMSLQRQIADTQDAAHASRLEAERVLAQTEHTRRAVEDRVGKVKDNNVHLDTELGEIERQIEELKKISRTQMDEIRTLRDSNMGKEKALREEQRSLETMEMSVKDAMAAAREEKLRREEAERRRHAEKLRLQKLEEERLNAAGDSKKSKVSAVLGDDEGFYEGDREERLPLYEGVDAGKVSAFLSALPAQAPMKDPVPSEDVAEVQPWLTGMRAPSDWDAKSGSRALGLQGVGDGTAPEGGFGAEHVFGYGIGEGGACKEMVCETSSGKIVWGAASCGVVYDPRGKRQKVYVGHGAPITCMALHPAGRLVATGEKGQDAKIMVWDSETLETEAGLWGVHQVGVACINVSPDGTRIASVGLELDHSFCVWDWRSRSPLGVGKCGPCSVMACRFSPDGTEVVTSGVKHLKFWDVRASGALTPRKADLNQKATLQAWTSVAYLATHGEETPEDREGISKQDFICMAGAEDGNCYVFVYGVCRSVGRKHQGPVLAMTPGRGEDGTPFVLSGGSDGKVIRWEPNGMSIKPIGQAIEVLPIIALATENVLPSPFASDYAIAVLGMSIGGMRDWGGEIGRKGRVCFVTSRNEIYAMPFDLDSRSAARGGVFEVTPLLMAHCGPITAADVHPTKGECVTGGADGTLRLWDLETRELKAYLMLEGVRSVAYSPDGTLVCVGIEMPRKEDGGDKEPSANEAKIGKIVVLDLPGHQGCEWAGGDHLPCLHRGLDGEPLEVSWLQDGPLPASRSIRYSPDGQLLGVGFANGRISVIRAEDSAGRDVYEELENYKTHRDPVVSIDWSEQGEGMASSDTEGHLIFWGVAAKGKPAGGGGGVSMSPRKEKGAPRFLWEDKEVGGARDTIWSTWHSTIGWGVQNACGALGALAGGMASSLAVARGRMELVSCETGGAGELKLVKYPALPGAKARGFAGHASPPDAIRYLVEDSGVLSAGRDGCVMVWRRGDAPQDVSAVEDSNSHRHEQEVVGCAPRSVQGGFRRPSRGVLVRLSSGGQSAEMPTDAERALMEKALAEDVAGVLHAGGHGDLSRPMEHLAFDRVRCSMFQDGAGGALAAEVELLPDPRGWWVEPTPRDMYHCLEECVATLDTAKNRLKSFANGGITLVEEEEGDPEAGYTVLESDGIPPWVKTSAPPTDWDPLKGSLTLALPPTEHLVQTFTEDGDRGEPVSLPLMPPAGPTTPSVPPPASGFLSGADAAPAVEEEAATPVLQHVHGYNGSTARDNGRYVVSRMPGMVGEDDYEEGVDRLTYQGRIVYSAGALGVCVGDKGGDQTLLSGHRGGVSCLSIDPTGRYILTGEGCSGGGCMLWDLLPSTGDTARAITRLGWVHSGGVLAAFFLPGGQGGGRCVTVGASGHHEVALWEWSGGSAEGEAAWVRLLDSMVSVAVVGTQTVVCACPAGEDAFVTAGGGHMMMWRVYDDGAGGAVLDGKAGIWGLKSRPSQLKSVGMIRKGDDARGVQVTVATGDGSGGLLLWRGRQLVQRVASSHVGGVNCVSQLPMRGWTESGGGGISGGGDTQGKTWLATGGGDGTVGFWEVDDDVLKKPAKCAAVIDVAGAGKGRSGAVTSLDSRSAHEGWSLVLVGLSGCCLCEIEVDLRDPRSVRDLSEARRMIASGHALGVSGLASHPDAGVCATVGDDGCVMCWDVDGCKLMWRLEAPLPDKSSGLLSVDWRAGGRELAVGFGKGSGGGGIAVLDAGDAAKGSTWQEAVVARRGQKKGDVREVKFSPDGSMVAAAGREMRIDIYKSDPDYFLFGSCTGHDATICHLDWSDSCQLLRSGDAGRTAIVWDVANKTKTSVPKLADAHLRVDEPWSSYNVPLTWATKGLATALPSMSCALSIDLSHDSSTLALGDAFGGVSLHRFPLHHPSPPPLSAAHTSRAARVRFTADDAHLLSVGGGDGTLVQWRTPRAPLTRSREIAPLLLPAPPRDAPAAEGGEDEDMACLQPFEAAVHAPSNWGGGDATLTIPPLMELELEHVYGYSGYMGRGNCHTSSGGRIIYPAASVCVSQETCRPAPGEAPIANQRIVTAHTAEVTCLTRHPNCHVFASGQRSAGKGSPPRILCWDESRLDSSLRGPKIVSELVPGPEADSSEEGRVYSLAFSRDGTRLAAVGGSPRGGGAGSWLCVWDWKSRARLAGCIIHAMPTLAIEFEPWQGGGLVACGISHVRFLTYAEKGTLSIGRGKFAGRTPCTSYLSIAFARTWCVRPENAKEEEWRTLTGSQEGDIVVWKDRIVQYAVKGHSGPIWDMSVLRLDKRDHIATAGADGEVGLWMMLWGTESTRIDDLGRGIEGIVRTVGDRVTDEFPYGKGLSLSDMVQELACPSAIRDPATSPVAIRSVLYEYSPLKTGAISCLSLLLGTACNEVIRVTLQNEGSSVDKMNTDRISGSERAYMSVKASTGEMLTAVEVLVQGPCPGEGDAHMEVRGVASNGANEKEVATVGSDGIVRVYDSQARKAYCAMLACEKGTTHCLAYSRDSRGYVHLAAGMRDKIWVYNALQDESEIEWDGAPLATVTVLGQSGGDNGPGKRTVTCLRYSTGWDGQTKAWLAAGTEEGVIILYQANLPAGVYTKQGVIRGHRGRVTAIDFEQVPTDNKPMVMRSNSSALELCFWDVATRKELPAGQQRDKAWSSSSCHLSWTTQGLVPQGGNLASITSVDRSKDLQLLAAGGWGGDISLGRCPVILGSRRVHGGVKHGCGAVGGVRFSCSGHYVWSVGGRDMALLQWRVQAPANDSLAKGLITLEHVPIRQPPLNSLTAPAAGDSDDAIFGAGRPYKDVAKLIAPAGFDNVEPPEGKCPPPRQELELEHVHGVSGGLSPLAFNNKSNLVVAAASVAYIQKPGGGEQIAFYSKGHKSAITCLAVDGTGEYAATGQAGPEAKVCVWDSSTAMHLAELICPHEEHAVAAIAWCSDSERIASVGTDPLHTLCVWRWRGGEAALLHSTPTETLGVLCLGWSPAGGSGAWIVQGGEQHVLFWKVEEGSGGDDEMAIGASKAASKLVGTKGVLGPAGGHVTACCVGFLNATGADPDPDLEPTEVGGGYTITGMLDGAVFLWKAGIRPSVLRVLPAQHDGAVLSICVSAGLVVTGGADGMIKVWSVEGKVEEGTNEDAGDKKDGKEGKEGKTEMPLGRTGYGGGISSEKGESGEENESGNRAPDKVMDIAKMLQEGAHSPFLHSDGGLAAVQCLHVKHTRISDGDGERYGSGWSFVMSTKGREVVEVTLEDLNPSTFPTIKVTAVGHATGSARSLSVHPSGWMCATTADDGVVRVWNTQKHRCVGALRVSSEGDAALSVDWRGPNGSQIAVGLARGGVHVFNVQESSSGDVSLTNPTSVGAQKYAANAVKYSPGGDLLAVGLASGDIEVYDAKQAYQLRGCCRGHTGALRGVDWSESGAYLQSWCDAGETRYWTMTALKPGPTSTSPQEYQLQSKPFTLLKEPWATMTCPLVWAARGAWRENEEGERCAVARLTDLQNPTKPWLVAGGSKGEIRVFSYPACQLTGSAQHFTALGHSYMPTAIACDEMGQGALLSAGGEDLTVMQWRVRT